MENVFLKARHVRVGDAIFLVEMREIAEHPADRIAQFAVGVDRGLEDLRPDALIIPIIGCAGPQPQNIGARLLDYVLGRDHVAERLRHLVAGFIENEAVGHDDVEGGTAARAAGFQKRGLEPATVLVGAFEIHHDVRAAVVFAPDAGEAREMFRVFEHESMRRARIEPHVENVIDLLPIFVGTRAKETLPRAFGVPGVGAFLLECIGNAGVYLLVVQDFGGTVALLPHEYRYRHAPGALARDDPVGSALDHSVDTVLALWRHPTGRPDRGERTAAQGVAHLYLSPAGRGRPHPTLPRGGG